MALHEIRTLATVHVRFLLLAVLLALSSSAQAPQSESQAIEQKVDSLFSRWDKRDSPGCALAILKDGKVLYKRGYGMADLEHSIAISPNTVFEIASTSKQFTAMAVILLAEEGKLSLDDPVRRYIPELPDYGAPITLRHLLYHTSGLRNLFVLYQLAGWRWGDVVNEKNELDLIARQREPNFKPGDEHAYSNTGYFLLAEIVKRVSHQSFTEFVRTRIFDPLGMTSTMALDNNGLLISNRALAYNSTAQGFTNNVTLTETVGDSNIYTTAEDMARWDANFYAARVGGRHAIAEMETPGILNSGEPTQYAGGLNITTHKGLRMIWHSGTSNYRAEYLRFPDQHFSVICFCNSGSIDPSNLSRKVAELYLSGLMRSEPVKPPSDITGQIQKLEESARAGAVTFSPEKLQVLAGSYLTREALVVRRIFLEGGRLMVERGGGLRSELVATGERTFLMLGVPEKVEVRFSGEPEGALQITLIPPSQKPIVADRVDPTIAPDFHQYEGNFWSSDVGEIVTLASHDKELWLQTKRKGEFALHPVAADIFKNEWLGKVMFHRKNGGSVTSLVMSNGEVRHLEMQKVTVKIEPVAQ